MTARERAWVATGFVCGVATTWCVMPLPEGRHETDSHRAVILFLQDQLDGIEERIQRIEKERHGDQQQRVRR